MLKNDVLVAKIGVDIAANEPPNVDERPRRACRANSVPGCAECLRRIFNADGTIIGIWFSWPNRT